MTKFFITGVACTVLALVLGCGGNSSHVETGDATSWPDDSSSAIPQSPSTQTTTIRRDPPPITDADWPSYNHDVRGWRFNSGEKTLSAENASELEEK